jgi:hypothetical protein
MILGPEIRHRAQDAQKNIKRHVMVVLEDSQTVDATTKIAHHARSLDLQHDLQWFVKSLK